MKIPNEIKVGPYTFKVVFEENLWTVSESRGQFRPSTKEIALDKKMDKSEYLPEVFIHEVLEAIKWTYNIDISHNSLNLLGLGLTQALEFDWRKDAPA